MFLASQTQNFRKNQKFYALAALLIIALLIWIAVFARAENYAMVVNFFDIGQGDAIFIEVPGGAQVLIDGGPDDKILEKLGRTMPFWDRTIDMIVLSHPEKDHVSGLLEVLKRYKVDYIVWTGVVRDTSEYQEWQKLIQEEGAIIKIAQASQRVTLLRNVLDSGGEIYLDILYPLENLDGEEVKESNNTSLVSRLVFGNTSFLFTGDIEKSAEYELLGQSTTCSNSRLPRSSPKAMVRGELENRDLCKFAILDSDVLKVAHHGSKTSSNDFFIRAVSPEIAVIQVGRDNRYGHPVQEVLDKLAQNSIKIFRTDLDGDIEIISNGVDYEVRD